MGHWDVTKPLSIEGNIPSSFNIWELFSDLSHVNYAFGIFNLYCGLRKCLNTFQNFNDKDQKLKTVQL